MSTAPALPTLLVIPTGIGCAVGGYAGDALPAARLPAPNREPMSVVTEREPQGSLFFLCITRTILQKMSRSLWCLSSFER